MGKRKKRKLDVDSSVFEPKRDNAYCTVKTSLKSILRDVAQKDIIQDIVIRCNDIVTEAYQFIRLYCLHLFHNQQNLPHSMRSLSSIASKQSAKETRGGRNPPMLICNQSWMHSTPTTSEPFLIMTKNTIFVTSLSTFRTLRRKCIQPFITI